MSGSWIGAAATVVVGLLSLLGAWWLRNVQARTAKNEERLSRYESWDRLIENYERDNARLRGENSTLRRRVQELSKGDPG